MGVDIKSIKNQIERLVIISYLINGKFPREFSLKIKVARRLEGTIW